MTMAVGWQAGPDDDDGFVADPIPDPPCLDVEDLLAPTDEPPPALLLAADPAQLPGQWVDQGMSTWFAHANQVALAQARWMLEASRAQADTTVRVLDRARPGKIVAASLGWSESYAAARLEFARQVLERLPALGAAMADGRLEEHKAGLFATTLAELDTTQARVVVDRILPAAPRLAFGVLRARIEKAAEDVDPAWAETRRAAAVARRRVAFRIAPSGAADLCGLDLPEEPAQDAHDRIVALARVVARRLRRAGLDAPTGPIQSEVMLTLTGPDGAGMWDRDVVDHVTLRFGGPTTEGPDEEPDDGGPDDGGPDDTASGPGGPGDTGLDNDGPDEDPGDGCPEDSGAPEADEPDRGPDEDGPDDTGPDAGGPDDGEELGPEDGRRASRTAADGGHDDPDPDRGSPPRGAEDRWQGTLPIKPGPGSATDPAGDTNAGGGQEAPWRVRFVPRVALRVGLRTVLGLDRRAGQLPGHGAVTNTVAVAMAWKRIRSRVRLLLYTAEGHLEHALTVHPPGRGHPPPHADRRRHQIVELTAYTHELDTLSTALAGEQLALDGRPPPGDIPAGVLIHGDALGLLERAARALAAARARPIEDHPAHTTAEEAHRHPGAALRAWVQARDQTCRSPGCATDATTCDLDHTLPVTEGGLTRADGLGPFCRRDHTFKHDPDTGWTVAQTSPGRFAWTSPTGRLHTEEPEPYDPGPDPVPRSDPDHHDLPGLTPDPVPPVIHPPGSPRRNTHGYLTRAAVDTAARLRERARRRAGEPGTSGTDLDPGGRFPEEPPF